MVSEADAYYKHFSKRVVETNDDFTILEATFTTQNPNFPSKAWLKVFHTVTDKMHRELPMLIRILQDLPPNHVVKYLHHIISKGKLYLFLELCSKTLAKEIAQRKRAKRRWGEGEILEYMREMLVTIKILHSYRIVHRNISPSTIFIHENQLKLGHFEDSKEIHRGVTQQPSTLHPEFEGYFSPEFLEAYRSGKDVSYEVAYRNDIWALGRVFYDVAMLRSNEEIVTLFEEGQRAFATCLERELRRVGFSMRFVNIIQKMLTLDSTLRPEAETLLKLVNDAIGVLPRCHKCGESAVSMFKICQHSFCEECIASMITEAMKRNETLESLQCDECGVICSQIETAVQHSPLKAKMDLLRLNDIVKCRNEACAATHPRVDYATGKAKPYLVKCICAQQYCSYCHCDGHGFLSMFSKCPRFPLE